MKATLNEIIQQAKLGLEVIDFNTIDDAFENIIAIAKAELLTLESTDSKDLEQ